MIIPFTRGGFYYEAKRTKEGWRILIRMNTGDHFFDSAVYPEEVCRRVVQELNEQLIERRKDR